MSTLVKRTTFLAAFTLSIGASALVANAQSANDVEKMSFFITSVGTGDGANFGGLEGADAHCGALASTAGSTKKWAAYLSSSMIIDRSSGTTQITEGINARDRIGTGPWYNIKGCLLYTSPSPRDQRGSRMPSSA